MDMGSGEERVRRLERVTWKLILLYAKQIANKQSLIFFIRKIKDPTNAFIAMEYKHGKVEQLRYDKNITVTDEKIIKFADALAAKLTQLDIINELRRTA